MQLYKISLQIYHCKDYTVNPDQSECTKINSNLKFVLRSDNARGKCIRRIQKNTVFGNKVEQSDPFVDLFNYWNYGSMEYVPMAIGVLSWN